MARQPKLPSPSEFSREWSRLDRDDKRRIRRAVNRMQPAASRRDARLAAVFAQNQQRTAKWLLPVSVILVAALQLPQGLEAVLAMGAVGLVLFGFITFAIAWRARRAERLNLAVLDGSQALGREGRGGKDREQGRGRRRRRGSGAQADPDDAEDPDADEAPEEQATHGTGGDGASSSPSGSGARRRKRAHTDGRPRQGKRSSRRKRSKARSKR